MLPVCVCVQGYYFTGDGCKRDKDGYFWITGQHTINCLSLHVRVSSSIYPFQVSIPSSVFKYLSLQLSVHVDCTVSLSAMHAG